MRLRPERHFDGKKALPALEAARPARKSSGMVDGGEHSCKVGRRRTAQIVNGERLTLENEVHINSTATCAHLRTLAFQRLLSQWALNPLQRLNGKRPNGGCVDSLELVIGRFIACCFWSVVVVTMVL